MNWKQTLALVAILAAGTAGAFYLVRSDDDHPSGAHEHEHHDESEHEHHDEDTPEAQTTLSTDMATQAGVVVETAGSAALAETFAVYGQVRLNADRITRATARFAGVVVEARKSLGESVRAGETVATVESNESLSRFEVKSPGDGIVVERAAAAGETVAEGTPLYTIADVSEIWIDLAIPRGDQSRIRIGQPVILRSEGHPEVTAEIAWLSPLASAETQTLTARVVLPNPDARWHPGLFVEAEIVVASSEVPVAIKPSALQTLDGADVVFVQEGEVYRARPVKLGRRNRDWIEILAGLSAGERHVTGNSFLIKADIGKAGASHDH